MVIQHSIQQQKEQAGFTLVELSIVLVIIGLIVSGVLVGQDMIRAAEIRSTVSQIESYNSAVNTFRDKYNGLPGDLAETKAGQFGFELTTAGTRGLRDGNRMIEGGAADAVNLQGETALFWLDLSAAGLTGSDLAGADGTGGVNPGLTLAQLERWLPLASIGQGHFITTYSSRGRNYFQISQVDSVAAGGAHTLTNGMTPQTAFNIDDKLDDGNPFRGSVRAGFGADLNLFGAGVIIDAAAPAALTTNIPATAATDCAGTTAAGVESYNTVTEELANNPACHVRIRASF